jgi:primosomal protein N' (replication factor Y)
MRQRIARGEQSLVLLNRRGYAPVLHCAACGWKSGCPHCSAWRVFHKADRTLRCHHCGFTERVPRACPDCGNLDIAPVGRGTEKLEEQLAEAAARRPRRPHRRRHHPRKGALEAQLAEVHAGEVDVLVGTQMVAKGHDFPPHHAGGGGQPGRRAVCQRLPCPRAPVCAADAGRRPGRARRRQAGTQRDVGADLAPHAPAVRRAAQARLRAFAASQLKEREMAGLPPFATWRCCAARHARLKAKHKGVVRWAIDVDPVSI